MISTECIIETYKPYYDIKEIGLPLRIHNYDFHDFSETYDNSKFISLDYNNRIIIVNANDLISAIQRCII